MLHWERQHSMYGIVFQDFIYLFSERGEGGRKKEKNIEVRETHPSFSSRKCADLGPHLQPRHVPGLGIKLATFLSPFGILPNHWDTPVRACIWYSCAKVITSLIMRKHQMNPNWGTVQGRVDQNSLQGSRTWKQRKAKGLPQMGGDEGDMTIHVVWGPGVGPGMERGHWLKNWWNPARSTV